MSVIWSTHPYKVYTNTRSKYAESFNRLNDVAREELEASYQARELEGMLEFAVPIDGGRGMSWEEAEEVVPGYNDFVGQGMVDNMGKHGV